MRQSIGTTSLFQIIIGFTLLFAAFLAVAVTYNRVFRLKNETLNIIEKYEGISEKSIRIINNYLDNSGYNTMGYCENGEYGISNLSSNTYEKVTNENKKYYYCLSYYCQDDTCNVNSDKLPNGNQIFFKVKLFFKFNIPFIGDLMTFKITGDTKAIKLWGENQKLS